MFNLSVIGVSDDALSVANKEILSGCSHVFATPRLQKHILELPIKIHNISPIQQAIDEIRTLIGSTNVALLASGDPLYYGIGKKLLLEFPTEIISFFPAVSSIQRACALFKTHWDDAIVVSLHGRNNLHLPGLILQHPKCILLTDKQNSPDTICKNILEYFQLIGAEKEASNINVMVAENIGLENQRLFAGDLTEVSMEKFSPLNVLLIQTQVKDNSRYPATFGLTEDDIIHSRGLITKNEVRAATLHQLRLKQEGVLWDIGAGSGSISLEAARSTPGLTVYSVEHKEEEICNIKNNIIKFGSYNMVPVFGRAPENLTCLPDPDCVFIGGSSGSLAEIVSYVAERLQPGGRLVINGVIEKTITEAPMLMAKHGFSMNSSVLRVSRTEADGTTRDFNPITILTGTK